MIDFSLGMQEVRSDVDAITDVLLSPEVGVAEVLLAPRSDISAARSPKPRWPRSSISRCFRSCAATAS